MDTFHGRCPASFLARLQTARTSPRPSRVSTVPPYRKCTCESFRPASGSLPLHAKSRCPHRRRPSPAGSSPRPRARLSFETTPAPAGRTCAARAAPFCLRRPARFRGRSRSEEHTSELQSRLHLVCRLLLEKKNVVAHRTSVG